MIESKANFGLNVFNVDPDVKLPKGQFAINLSYLGQACRATTEFRPSLTIASLMLLQHGGQFTHAGMTVYVAEDEKMPTCITEWWPMTQDVPAIHSTKKGVRTFQHTFRAEGDGINFMGGLQHISSALADDLRAHIGPSVPETIRQIFWSEREIAQIEANSLAQHRYEKLAQELIDSLYE